LIFPFLSDLSVWLSSRSILLPVRFCSSFRAQGLALFSRFCFTAAGACSIFVAKYFPRFGCSFPLNRPSIRAPCSRTPGSRWALGSFYRSAESNADFFGLDPQPLSCSARARWIVVFLLPSMFFRCQFSARWSSASVAPRDRSPVSVLSVPSADLLFCP
jgi:hypothetical protein